MFNFFKPSIDFCSSPDSNFFHIDNLSRRTSAYYINKLRFNELVAFVKKITIDNDIKFHYISKNTEYHSTVFKLKNLKLEFIDNDWMRIFKKSLFRKNEFICSHFFDLTNPNDFDILITKNKQILFQFSKCDILK